jgi:drug/metabolite transporter (DMT)-like permease
MVAFAGNSLLCRAALADSQIGSVGFSALRLAAGALALAAVMRVTRVSGSDAARPRRPAALALLAYAVCFSIAYVTLDAGTGALVLFAAVQLTMMASSVIEGERPSPRVWLGSGVAFAGLVALVWPGVSAPDPLGAALMAIAGVGWGIYSLYGRGSASPIATNAINFARATPLALAGWGLAMVLSQAERPGSFTVSGVGLALASGAVTSGLGYALWYRTLRHLTTTTAAVAQLSVPVIAAAGGVLVLDERLTSRMVAASAVVLLGIALASIRPPASVRPAE